MIYWICIYIYIPIYIYVYHALFVAHCPAIALTYLRLDDCRKSVLAAQSNKSSSDSEDLNGNRFPPSNPRNPMVSLRFIDVNSG